MTTDPYQRLTRCIEGSALSPSPAEVHGILCGLICAGHPDPQRTWLAELGLSPAPKDLLAKDLLAGDCEAQLCELAERTSADIEGPGLGFSPLLPSDEAPLRERAQAVYDWCRGFLFGLGLAGIGDLDLSEQTREVFHDFTEITRLDVAELEEGEDNEDALTEIVEFLWVAAMLVYEERVSAKEGV